MHILNRLNELKKEELQILLKSLQPANVKYSWNKKTLIDRILQKPPKDIIQSLSDEQIDSLIKGETFLHNSQNINPRAILQNHLNETKYSNQKFQILESLPTFNLNNHIPDSNLHSVKPHQFRGGSNHDYEVFIGEAGTYCTRHKKSNKVIQSVSPENTPYKISTIAHSIITQEIFLKLSQTVLIYKHYTQLLLCNQEKILHEIQSIKQIIAGVHYDMKQGFKHLEQLRNDERLFDLSTSLNRLIKSFDDFIETEYSPEEGALVREKSEDLLSWLEENKWDKSNPGYYSILLIYVFTNSLLIEVLTRKGSKYKTIIRKRLKRTKDLLQETIKSYLQDKTPYELFVLYDECTAGYLNIWFELNHQIQSYEEDVIQFPTPNPWNDYCSVLRDILNPKNNIEERLLTVYDSIEDESIVNITVGQILGQLGVPNPEQTLLTSKQVSLLHQFTTSDMFSIFEKEIQEHLNWKEFKLKIPDPKKVQIKDFVEITFGVPQKLPTFHKMIYIPKGQYKRKDSCKKETVSRSFFIGKYPVTQKEYFNLEQYMLKHHPKKLDAIFKGMFVDIKNDENIPLDKIMMINCEFKGKDRPVESLSYYQALLYCMCRSHLEQLESPYFFKNGTLQCDFEKNGYRLPTSNEWEYCAIADEYKRFYDGHFNSLETRDVDSGKPNQWGIYDIIGNIEEMIDVTPFEWEKKINKLISKDVDSYESLMLLVGMDIDLKTKGSDFSSYHQRLNDYSDNRDLIFKDNHPDIFIKGKNGVGFRIYRTV